MLGVTWRTSLQALTMTASRYTAMTTLCKREQPIACARRVTPAPASCRPRPGCAGVGATLGLTNAQRSRHELLSGETLREHSIETPCAARYPYGTSGG